MSERYKSVVIDEAQDLGPHMLKFVRSLTSKKNNESAWTYPSEIDAENDGNRFLSTFLVLWVV